MPCGPPSPPSRRPTLSLPAEPPIEVVSLPGRSRRTPSRQADIDVAKINNQPGYRLGQDNHHLGRGKAPESNTTYMSVDKGAKKGQKQGWKKVKLSKKVKYSHLLLLSGQVKVSIGMCTFQFRGSKVTQQKLPMEYVHCYFNFFYGHITIFQVSQQYLYWSQRYSGKCQMRKSKKGM